MTSVSPPHVEVEFVAPHEDTEIEVKVGVSSCDEGGSARLGTTGVVPFCWVVDSGMSGFVIVSTPSFDSSKDEGAPSVCTGWGLPVRGLRPLTLPPRRGPPRPRAAAPPRPGPPLPPLPPLPPRESPRGEKDSFEAWAEDGAFLSFLRDTEPHGSAIPSVILVAASSISPPTSVKRD